MACFVSAGTVCAIVATCCVVVLEVKWGDLVEVKLEI